MTPGDPRLPSLAADLDIRTDLPMYRRARLGIGYLPQEASIFRGMSVEQNIRAVLEVVEKDRDTREAMLDELLAGGDGFGDGLALGLFGDGLDEIAGDGEGDVGLQQGHADFAQRGRDVIVAERALFGELAEDAGKPVGQVLEHGPRLSSTRIAPVGATR